MTRSAGLNPSELAQLADRALAELCETAPTGKRSAVATAARFEKIVRKMFVLLAEPGTDGEPVPRATTLGEIMRVGGAPLELVWQTVQAFQREGRNLVVASARVQSEPTRIEVGEPSLLHAWPAISGPDGWLERERHSVAELRYFAAHAERPGDFLTAADIERALEWRRLEEPNAAWAARYVEEEAWERTESHYRESRKEQTRLSQVAADARSAEQNRVRRRRLFWMWLALGLGVGAAAAWGWHLVAQQQIALERKLNAGPQRRSRHYRDQAGRLLAETPPDRVGALGNLAEAVRLDPGDQDSFARLCHLLGEQPWAPPLTAALASPDPHGLAAIALHPQGRIVALGKDGFLYRATTDGTRLDPNPVQSLIAGQDVPVPQDPALPARDTEPSQWSPPALLGAAFSPDATTLLLFPNFVEAGAEPTCAVWHWDGQQYQPAGPALVVKDRGLQHEVTWSPDARAFILTRWDGAGFQFFQFADDQKGFVERTLPPSSLTTDPPNAAGFSPDGKYLVTVTATTKPIPRARLCILDVATLARPNGKLPWRTDFQMDFEGQPRQVFFGPTDHELTVQAWQQATKVVDMIAEESHLLAGPNFKPDRLLFLRESTAPTTPGTPLPPLIIATSGRHVMFLRDGKATPPAIETIDAGAPVSALAVDLKNERLATGTGASFGSVDSARGWDFSRRPEVRLALVPDSVTGPPPDWLVDLATLISGRSVPGLEDETAVEPAVLSLERGESWHPALTIAQLLRRFEAEGSSPKNRQFEPILRRFAPAAPTP